MKQWTDYAGKAKDNRLTFSLGDAYAGEEKNMLLTLLVPSLKDLGPFEIASIEVTYAEIADQTATNRRVTLPVTINVAKAAQPKLLCRTWRYCCSWGFRWHPWHGSRP